MTGPSGSVSVGRSRYRPTARRPGLRGRRPSLSFFEEGECGRHTLGRPNMSEGALRGESHRNPVEVGHVFGSLNSAGELMEKWRSSSDLPYQVLAGGCRNAASGSMPRPLGVTPRPCWRQLGVRGAGT